MNNIEINFDRASIQSDLSKNELTEEFCLVVVKKLSEFHCIVGNCRVILLDNGAIVAEYPVAGFFF